MGAEVAVGERISLDELLALDVGTTVDVQVEHFAVRRTGFSVGYRAYIRLTNTGTEFTEYPDLARFMSLVDDDGTVTQGENLLGGGGSLGPGQERRTAVTFTVESGEDAVPLRVFVEARGQVTAFWSLPPLPVESPWGTPIEMAGATYIPTEIRLEDTVTISSGFTTFPHTHTNATPHLLVRIEADETVPDGAYSQPTFLVAVRGLILAPSHTVVPTALVDPVSLFDGGGVLDELPKEGWIVFHVPDGTELNEVRLMVGLELDPFFGDAWLVGEWPAP